jgi:hypothetical protein
MSTDLQARMFGAQASRKLCRDPWRGPQQEQPEAAPGTQSSEWRDQVDTWNGPAELAALAAGGPHHSSSVGEAQIRGLEHLRELWVFLCAHHELRVDGDDLVVATVLNELLDAIECGAHVEAVDPHPQDPCLFWRHYSMSSTAEMWTRAAVEGDVCWAEASDPDWPAWSM